MEQERLEDTGEREAQSPRPDGRADASSIRSGIFALILSGVIFSLVPLWTQEFRLAGLGTYVALRMNLNMWLELLELDPCWKSYKSGNPDAETYALSVLLEIWCNGAKVEPQQPPEPPPKIVEKPNLPGVPKVPEAPMAAPTGLRVINQIIEIQEIARCILELDDPDMLNQSRNASGVLDFSIYRWISRREKIINRNRLLGRPRLAIVQEQGIGTRPNPGNEHYFFKNLTLLDIRDLSNYEFPNLNMTFQAVEQSRIDLSPGKLSGTLFSVTLSACVSLLITLIYFSVWLGEIVAAKEFPSQGSLFGVFYRWTWSRSVFFVLLFAPAASTALLTFASRRILIGILSVLISTVTAVIIFCLWKRGAPATS